MGTLISTVFRTAILDDAAYEEWRERPNLFLRGILLILVVSLVAGLVSLAMTFVTNVSRFDPAVVEDSIRESIRWQESFNPGFEDPEARRMVDDIIDVIVPMVTELAEIQAPLPRGVTGFFQALGGWLSRAVSAIGGWLFYGALVLVVVNLLGGSAKLPDFLGTISLYVVPGLLGLLSPIPCVGGIIALIGTIWSIVVYVKAVSVATDLDTGQAILAVVAPFLAIVLLGLLVAIAATLWLVILF